MNRSPATHDLGTLDGFIAALVTVNLVIPLRDGDETVNLGDLWCPVCSGNRRVVVRPLWFDLPISSCISPRHVDDLTPSLWSLSCVQCQHGWEAAILHADDGPALFLSPSKAGGLTTPHSPETVRYFLGQASRTEAAGATGAAILMYRSAVEAVLHEQGFTARMLGPKLEALEKAIASGKAPQWTGAFDGAFLKVLKNLGNASTHADGIDVEQYRKVLTPELLAAVRVTVSELLELVYERPKETESRLEKLKQAHTKLQPAAKAKP